MTTKKTPSEEIKIGDKFSYGKQIYTVVDMQPENINSFGFPVLIRDEKGNRAEEQADILLTEYERINGSSAEEMILEEFRIKFWFVSRGISSQKKTEIWEFIKKFLYSYRKQIEKEISRNVIDKREEN